MTSDNAHALKILQESGSSMTQVMLALKGIEPGIDASRTLRLGLSAAITADALTPFLRKHAALAGFRAFVVQGGFDDPLGDIERFAAQGVTHVVLMPFLDAILPHLESRAASIQAAELEAKEAEFSARYGMALQRAAQLDTVFVCGLHRMTRAVDNDGDDAVERIQSRFNQLLRALVQAHPNAKWIDTAGVIQELGLDASIDSRFYFRAKAPYSTRYMDALAAAISVASRGFGSYFYKCLALDCDNTLWGGILGEDGLEGIQLDPFDYPGNIFWRVQHQLAQLQQQGVLLCLCTKNNPADVEEALTKHPAMVLKASQIVVSKVNWQDKPQNLREIAAELNLGLDSIVFVDDSAYECDAVRSQLPQVRVLQVPANLPDYPRLIAQAGNLLLGAGISGESQDKTAQYQARAAALAAQAQFSSQEDYLRSLGLKVILSRNARESIARISELSQKSNQFNLTTQRYSAARIAQFMESQGSVVYSLVVKDRFGDAGLSGVAVLIHEEGTARVDNFFMSCRVIGRGVEFAIWQRIAQEALRHGASQLVAHYIPTAKNNIVATFYDQLGLHRTEGAGPAATYTFDLACSENLPACDHVELTYVG